MKADSEKERILRAFASERMNRIVDDRIHSGSDLTNAQSLYRSERVFALMILRASPHAGQMTPGERRFYRQARAAYRAMLTRRKR
jgi:hypothetical protein